MIDIKSIPTIEDYRADLENAGFAIEHCEDMTADWGGFTRQRLQAYRADRDRHVEVRGAATVAALDDFFGAVDHHFQSGRLEGVRLCARRGDQSHE